MNAPRFAVLGGSGRFGLGLAWRLGRGGAEVVIGSRDEGRAVAAADRVRGGLDGEPSGEPAGHPSGAGALRVTGATNRQAVDGSDAVFLSVPYDAQEALLEEVGPAVGDRLVICCGVIWPPGSRPETSAAEEAEQVLRRECGGPVRVAAAFQTVAAAVLRRPPPLAGSLDERTPDALVCADDPADRAEAVRVAGYTGLRAVPVGPLRRARAAEAALGILLELNRGAARHAGLRVTGLDP